MGSLTPTLREREREGGCSQEVAEAAALEAAEADKAAAEAKAAEEAASAAAAEEDIQAGAGAGAAGTRPNGLLSVDVTRFVLLYSCAFCHAY